MLPIDADKPLMQWTGPFKIEKKAVLNDFKIKFKGKSEVYHVNMLTKYAQNEEKPSQCH